MYKVFINDKVICFTNNLENCSPFSDALVLSVFSSLFTTYVTDLLCSSKNNTNVFVIVENYSAAFKMFQKNFKIIEAAGGIVSNKSDEKLFIYRLDKWDLPKGKIEDGEEIEEAAIREVEEECGINGLTIRKSLNDTFHIYRLNGQLILKQTYWFEMKTNYEGKLSPQLEENITKVEWLSNDEIEEKIVENTYASIKELLNSTLT